ncbi:unnamed protein product, partial [Albugo candida]
LRYKELKCVTSCPESDDFQLHLAHFTEVWTYLITGLGSKQLALLDEFSRERDYECQHHREGYKKKMYWIFLGFEGNVAFIGVLYHSTMVSTDQFGSLKSHFSKRKRSPFFLLYVIRYLAQKLRLIVWKPRNNSNTRELQVNENQFVRGARSFFCFPFSFLYDPFKFRCYRFDRQTWNVLHHSSSKSVRSNVFFCFWLIFVTTEAIKLHEKSQLFRFKSDT